MSKYKRILLPVDFSSSSLSALGFATQLAIQNDAKLCFVYVVPPPLPAEQAYGAEVEFHYEEHVQKELEQLEPADPSVKFEHVMLRGNAGPEIVKLTGTADLCVMSTHGRSGIARFFMGSVAQYVLRNSKCPVILVKGMDEMDPDEQSDNPQSKQFVSEVMHQVAPIHKYDKMTDVLVQLRKANETGAPVTDDRNRCIGILTTTDIDKYHSLKKRHEAGDETVVAEMFETDKYGHVRCDNASFEEVRRHMTEEVITVQADDSILDAIKTFEAHPEIHHLVVVDEDSHPVGIIESAHVVDLDFENGLSTQQESEAQATD